MSDLVEKSCKPCEGDVDALTSEQAKKLLPDIPGWALSEDAKVISRNYDFRNFLRTMSFVNAVAWIANHENHHPDMEVGYNYCNIRFSTHAIDGLSENDFICAAKINAL